jgi:molecular chaperone HscB
VNDAYRVLKDELKRAEALLSRHGAKPSEAQGAQDPELLMEIMELRESLADAKLARDLGKARVLASDVRERELLAKARLREALTALAAGRAALQDDAEHALARLKYYRRFQDEVASMEEDALG